MQIHSFNIEFMHICWGWHNTDGNST